VPKWLQAELGIANERVEPTLTAPSGEQLRQRVHPVDQLLTGGVCRSCNNGWMSQLRVNRHGGSSSAHGINSNDHVFDTRRASRALTLGRENGLHARPWRLRVKSVVGSRRRPVHQRTTCAGRVYVFARQQAKTRSWCYIESAWWKHAELENEAAERVKRESYKLAIQFGDLMLFVVYWPLANWGLRVESGELSKLWPPAAIVKQFEHPEPQDVTASEDACSRYVTTISVVPHHGAEGLVHTKRRLTSS